MEWGPLPVDGLCELRGRVPAQVGSRWIKLLTRVCPGDNSAGVRILSPHVYKYKGPGQGPSLKASGGLNRDSNSEYPENIPSRIERSEVRESPRVEGGCTGATASWHPTIAPFTAEQAVTG